MISVFTVFRVWIKVKAPLYLFMVLIDAPVSDEMGLPLYLGFGFPTSKELLYVFMMLIDA